MASEKMRSRFRESITSMPATPSADAQTLKKLEGDFPSVLSPQSPERPLRGYPPSRSGHSSFSGTPVMNPPDAKEPALVSPLTHVYLASLTPCTAHAE